MGPPIGAIVRNLESALPDSVRDHPTPEQEAAIQTTYDRFDARYWDRPDYRLWRCAMYPYFARRKPWLAGRRTRLSATWTDGPALAQLAAESSDPVVFWSTVALAPDLIEAVVGAGDYGPSAPIWPFVCRLHSRLVFDASPLPHCHASCGMAALIFLVKFHYLYSQAGYTFPLSALADFATQVTGWISLTDPAWAPGSRVDTASLERERKNRRGRLRAQHDVYEFGVLVRTLRTVGPLISTNINSLTSETVELQNLAYGCARSAWLTARSNRLWTAEHQRINGWFNSDRSKYVRRKAFLMEFRCLLNLGNQARNASCYLEASKFAYLLLRLIPDEFVDDPAVICDLSRRSVIYRYIKEAGLEVDSRFGHEQVEDRLLQAQRCLEARLNAGSALSEDEGRNDESDEIYDTRRDNRQRRTRSEINAVGLYYLVIEHDQQTSQEWKTVLKEIPNDLNQLPPKYLVSVMRRLADASAPASPDLLEAAYVLARRYGYVRSAGKILARAVYKGEFVCTKEHILDFVHSVRRCMALEPFGLRQEKVLEWRKMILDGCAGLYSRNADKKGWFSADEKYWIHETLIGRTHVHQRSLSTKKAVRLYRKAYGLFHFDDLREFYDQEYEFLKKPWNVATPETAAAFARKYEGTTLGAPVLVSVLCLPNLISLVAVGKDGQTRGGDVEIPLADLTRDVEQVVGGSEFWFRSPAVPFADQVDWRPRLHELADRIMDLAAECDATARVLVLALEPLLAELPWQHLLCSRAATRRTEMAMRDAEAATSLLASIVPSTSTITIQQPDDGGIEKGIRTVLSREGDEGDEAIRKVVKVTEDTIKAWRDTDASACVLVGHGLRREGSPLPGLRLGGGQELTTIDDWMGVMRSRHMLLHCCHSGTTEPIFMHELGGVPGIGLSLGVETFLAPVCEVRFSISEALQRSIFSGLGGTEIGIQYMNAICKNTGVCLYNIYGNPYEVFLKSQDSVLSSQKTAILQSSWSAP